MGADASPCADPDISLDKIYYIDDMADTAGEKGQVFLSDYIASKLRKYQSILIPVYEQANSAAIKFQKSHTFWIMVFILSSTIAVILALLQLYEPIRIGFGLYILAAEGMILGIGIFAIVNDMRFGKYHKKWIIERHRAERCRFLKFYDLLINDDAYFDQEIIIIKKITDFSPINLWIRDHGQNPDIIKKFIDKNNASHIGDIFNYFMCRRLFVQMNYFLKRHHENREKKELWTKKLPLFLISIAFSVAFFHIGWEIFQGLDLKGSSLLSIVGITLIFLAITLPIVVWTLNSFSTIFSYKANAGRYAGIYISVKDCLNKELFRNKGYETEEMKEEITNNDHGKKRIIGDINVQTESQYLKDLIIKFCVHPRDFSPTTLNLSSKDIFQGLLCLEDQLEREHEEWIRLTTDAISL
jgi:small basic protein